MRTEHVWIVAKTDEEAERCIVGGGRWGIGAFTLKGAARIYLRGMRNDMPGSEERIFPVALTISAGEPLPSKRTAKPPKAKG